MIGDLLPSLSVYVPPYVSAIDLNALNCLEDVRWERCGSRLLTFRVTERCAWPIQINFDFSRDTEGNDVHRYQMHATVVRCPFSSAIDVCQLCTDPSISGDLFPATVVQTNVEEHAYSALLCRLYGTDTETRSVWSLSTSRSANSSFYNGHAPSGSRVLSVSSSGHVQTVGSPFRVSLDLAPITVFAGQNKLLKGTASRDRIFCYCDYNVACKPGTPSGHRANVSDLVLHETLPFPRPDQRGFQRFHIAEGTILNSPQTTTVLFMFIITSVACLVVGIYRYATQKIIVLRDTREAEVLVEKATGET